MTPGVEGILERVNAGDVLFPEDLDVLAEEGERLFPEETVVESVRILEGRTGFDREVIRAAKALGCQAFRMGNRIDCRALWRFVCERYEEVREKMSGEGSLDAELKQERLLKLRAERAALEGKSLDKQMVLEWIEETALQLKALLRERIELALPEKVKGMSAAEMRPHCRSVVDEVCARFEEGAGKWRH